MSLYNILAIVVDFQLGKKITPEAVTRIEKAIEGSVNLTNAAEYHGVAPFFYDFICRNKLNVPTSFKRELQSLSLRHRHAAATREKIITDIIDCLNNAKIEVILLKGIALAYTIYPHPKYRPMRDIDILVSDSKLALAKSALTKIGFVFDSHYDSVYMGDMHHLPNAVKKEEGLSISLELHHQIYSRDTTLKKVFEQVRDHAQPMSVNTKCESYMLDHITMLDHLCRHSFGPANEVRLIHQFDIISYTQFFYDEIPWKELHAKHPFIINTLRCLHYSIFLPKNIKQEIGAPVIKMPDGVGKSLLPYSLILTKNKALLARIKKMFFPSAWWMHVNYNVPPEKSLFWCYLFRHPKRVIWDLVVRMYQATGKRKQGNSYEYR